MIVANEILVIGLGEIGKPLFGLVCEKHPATGIDVQPVDFAGECDIMHICFPFNIPDFIGECKRYIRTYRPELTIINSTVAAGTTRLIEEQSGCRVVNSPVRGKHKRMREELLSYTKYIGGTDADSCTKASTHFQSLGMKTQILASPEATEIAKLAETTYFGVLIAWAQEVERYCDRYGLEYDEVATFFEEIAYLPPVKFFPGLIGGHCVMPNIDILRRMMDSRLLDAIKESNRLKTTRESLKTLTVDASQTGRSERI
jgi:UDP-N-acetyl-D-mannosaminuronate dehydrogenase